MSLPNVDLKAVISGRINKGDEKGCWHWRGATGLPQRRGYGIFRACGKKVYAHRASYAEYVGEIPAGMEVCHKCDNPSCVNPEHLFLGTHKENMRDMAEKSRAPRPLPRDVKKQIRHLFFAETRRQSEIARHLGLRQSTVFGVLYPKRTKPG